MMESLNKQFFDWMIKKHNSGLFSKWQNKTFPPPAQESPDDFQNIERHPNVLRKHRTPKPHPHGQRKPAWRTEKIHPADWVTHPLHRKAFPTSELAHKRLIAMGAKPTWSLTGKAKGAGNYYHPDFGDFVVRPAGYKNNRHATIKHHGKNPNRSRLYGKGVGYPENYPLIVKDKRPYEHKHWTVPYRLPTGKYLGPVGSMHLKKGGPGSGPRKKGFQSLHGQTFNTRDEAKKAIYESGFKDPQLGEGGRWKHPQHGEIKLVYNVGTNKYVTQHIPPPVSKSILTKGLRGPKKGAKYHKLGAKDYLVDEPEVTQETTPAMRDYYHARSPEAFKKVVAEMRAREPKETSWGAWGTDIKGFHHEPLKFVNMLKRLRKAYVMEKGGPGSGRKKGFSRGMPLPNIDWKKQGEYLDDPEVIGYAMEAKKRREAKRQEAYTKKVRDRFAKLREGRSAQERANDLMVE